MKKNKKEGWIDFESEISKVIQNLDIARLNLINPPQKVNAINARQQIQNALFRGDFTPENYQRHKLKLIEYLNKLIRCLEIYYSDFIDYGDRKQLKEIASLDIHYVLSFNYTDTYQQLYCNGKFPKDRIDFIHGKASLYNTIQDCNMVLGIDEYLSGERMNKDNEFIQFKKFYQRIYKGTGCLHVDWLEEAKRANRREKNKFGLEPLEHTIYFYGHSLDVTDADIIRRLIMFEGVQTVIFHHNKEALGNQIANLVKVLGEEELIKRTDGTNSAIIFKQSSDETL